MKRTDAEKAYILEKVSELKAEFERAIRGDKIKISLLPMNIRGGSANHRGKRPRRFFAEQLGIPEKMKLLSLIKNLAIYTEPWDFRTFFQVAEIAGGSARYIQMTVEQMDPLTAKWRRAYSRL